MSKRILIIQGHPHGGGGHYCHALGEAYRTGAEAAGHEVELIDIGTVEIPALRDPADWSKPSEDEFARDAQAAVLRAEHLVVIYPLWMGTFPAHLKAFFERVFTEAFAFDVTDRGWHPRLKGRSAHVIVTMGMPAAFYRYYFFAHSLKNLRRNMLGFAGFGPIRDSLVGMVENPDPKPRARWLAKMKELGAKAA